VRIDQRKHLVAEARLDLPERDAVFLQARAPIREAVGRHFQCDLDRQPVAEPRRRKLGPGEERQVRARMPFRVGIEQVIRAGVVLIDAALDEPHPEHAGIEIDVLLRGARNRGDVMKSVNARHDELCLSPFAI
jgi:hypothetical protein